MFTESIYEFMQILQNSDNLLILSICKACMINFGIWNHWIESLTLS